MNVTKMRTITVFNSALTGNAGTEKCSSVVPDESLLDIPSMSEAVVKPVTSMMLLLLGRMVYC